MIETAELNLLPADEITAENTYTDPDTQTIMFDDAAAMKLILDDTAADDNFMNINQWAAAWTLADQLYQSPVAASAFDGGNVIQANVPKFVVSNHISSIVPRLMGGIFYEDPPFLLRPRPGTEQTVVTQKTAIFSAQLFSMHFEEECERALDQMALLGTCIMKWGYSSYTVIEKDYVPAGKKIQVPNGQGGFDETDSVESDEFDIVYNEKKISRPWIKYCDIRTVLVDAGCRFGDIRKAGHVIYRDFATYEDLNHLRETPGYDIPDETTLKAIFLAKPSSTGVDNIAMTLPEGMRGYLQHALPRGYKTTSDPYKNGLEILERWDKDKVIVILSANGHNILIRNESNPYGKIPFYSANWRNIQDSFYGQGLGLLIGGEQLVEQGITNLALDLLAYGLQPVAVRKKGFNVQTQNTRWRQGGIIEVDEDVDKAFKFLEMPNVPAQAWQFIAQAQTSAASTSGANEQVVQGAGALGARSTGMRSGTGAAAVVQANASRLDGPDGRFIRQIFEPWLYQMDEMNNDFMPTSDLKELLGDELGEQYAQNFNHIKYRKAKLEYEVLAGAHLGAKKEMTQALPIMFSLLNNPTFVANCNDAGWMFDAPAIFKAFVDAAGWKFSQPFLRQMTAQESQTHAANKPAAIAAKQAQAQQQSQLQKFQQQQQLEDQQQLGKAANEVLRQSLEQATTPEEVTGQPGGAGFGATTAL